MARGCDESSTGALAPRRRRSTGSRNDRLRRMMEEKAKQNALSEHGLKENGESDLDGEVGCSGGTRGNRAQERLVSYVVE